MLLGLGVEHNHILHIKYLDMASSSINSFSLALSQRIISKYKAKMAIA